jgi:hypothetical protein
MRTGSKRRAQRNSATVFCGGLGFEAEGGSEGVADHGKGDPCADEDTVPAHEAAAVAEAEEGAPELFDCSAGLAEAVAGGQVEYPDADDGENNDARDPDVAGDIVVVEAGEEEATYHWDQKCQNGGE